MTVRAALQEKKDVSDQSTLYWYCLKSLAGERFLLANANSLTAFLSPVRVQNFQFIVCILQFFLYYIFYVRVFHLYKAFSIMQGSFYNIALFYRALLQSSFIELFYRALLQSSFTELFYRALSIIGLFLLYRALSSIQGILYYIGLSLLYRALSIIQQTVYDIILFLLYFFFQDVI